MVTRRDVTPAPAFLLGVGFACLVFSSFFSSSSAPADIFGYKDGQGNYHIVSDPSQIPEEFQDGATRKTNAPPSPAAAPASGEEAAKDGESPLPPGGQYVVQSIDQRSGHIVLDVTLNGSTHQRMVVDTGATITGIPVAAASRLGLSIRPPVTVVAVQTASGVEVFPVVRMQSVEVGGAKVEDLPVILNPNLPGTGLLGVDFLSSFNFSVDSISHTLRLSPLDTTPRQGFYGGRPESWWKDKFANVQGNLNRLRQMRSQFVSQTGAKDQAEKLSVGPFKGASPRDLLAQIDMSVRFWELELRHTEERAAKARVPYGVR